MTKGFSFISDTDTEVIPKLVAHIANEHPEASFRQLVEKSISQLEGAFACVFKSSQFPGECVATRRGSPMVVGIKSGIKNIKSDKQMTFGKQKCFIEHGVEADSIPIQCSKKGTTE